MAQTEQGRLTEGPILKVLTKLALPIMASSFLSTAYSITDMAWIGTLGAKAVAGVGVGGMYVWLSQGLASLARMGGQVHVAQELGRGDRERAKKYSAAAIQLVIFFGDVYKRQGTGRQDYYCEYSGDTGNSEDCRQMYCFLSRGDCGKAFKRGNYRRESYALRYQCSISKGRKDGGSKWLNG